MQMEIVPVGELEVNCLLLWEDPASAWLVDPGADAEVIAAETQRHGLTVARILCTHGHIDHLGALDALLAARAVPVHMHPEDARWAFTTLNRLPPAYPESPRRPADLRTDLRDGLRLADGGLEALVLATPGHTPGGICLHLPREKILITGDTLFAGSVGRTDLPGGDWRKLGRSLARLLALPGETQVVPGHGPLTTIDAERRENPFLQRGAPAP
jgi:glyoxylase-like metal-dependent hydrolase (beta-lactamase superfamily II)